MSKGSIRIAGAGLAGLSAAIGLARRGHHVEVFDKNPDSGAARHSDWDAIENWTTEQDMLALLDQWGIAPSFEHRSQLDFEVYDKDGTCYPVTTPRPFFYLLKRGPERGSVEQELKQQALDHGVAIHYSRPCQRTEVDIWAAGSQHGGFFLGAGMTFRTHHPDLVLGLVSTKAAPKAYAYLVIVDGQGTLSVVLTRDFKQARAYLDHSIAIFRRAKQFDMTDVKMTSGFGGLAGAFWQPATNPIVVGEAAGFQDFLWGFGIRYALFSGHLAARAIDQGLDYEALVSREIRPLVRSSMVNRTLYDWAGDRTYRALIRRFSASPDLTRLTRRWYRGLAFRHLVWPIARRRYRSLKERPGRDSAAYLKQSKEEGRG
jgi:flavin-dependent dehydrogenase